MKIKSNALLVNVSLSIQILMLYSRSRSRNRRSRSRSRSHSRGHESHGGKINSRRLVLINVPYETSWQELKTLFREKGYISVLLYYLKNGYLEKAWFSKNQINVELNCLSYKFINLGLLI